MKRGFCHRTPMLAGCLPYLPHLPGICRTNSGEEREEVPISLSSKLAISRYAAKYVLVMNCYRLLTWCAQPVLSLCPYFHSWLSLSMMQSDLATSTAARQSRQCMSRCPMTVPGALLRVLGSSQPFASHSILKGQALSFRPAAEDFLSF